MYFVMIERNLEEKRSILQTAKKGFNKDMIGHDIIGTSLLNFLGQQTLPDNLPDFLCEPYVTRNEDGHNQWGFRLTHSTTTEAGETTVGFSVFSHLPMVNIDMNTGEATLTDEFKATLPEGIAREDKLEATQFFQNGMAKIGRQLPGEVDIDPLTHTIQLAADISNTHHVID